jgi:rod shape determining protein RodA
VGSGGAWGKGYLKGEHYMLGYLPPSVSSNDFIFAVLAEEAGFAGTVIVLLLFLFMTWTGLWVAFRCRDDGGRILCVGVVTVMFSHIFINIAMTIGLMPITGLPLAIYQLWPNVYADHDGWIRPGAKCFYVRTRRGDTFFVEA